MPARVILIHDAKQKKKKKLVVTTKMQWKTFTAKIVDKMKYKEMIKVVRMDEDDETKEADEITDVTQFKDMKEYRSYGITWDEFEAQRLADKLKRERREARQRRMREIKRQRLIAEAMLVEANESHHTFYGKLLKIKFMPGSEGKNAVVTGFTSKSAMVQYGAIKRGDLITAVNGVPTVDDAFRDIEFEIAKAGLPVTLTFVSGRIDFVQRRAVEFHEQLSKEVHVEDPFDLLYYEGARTVQLAGQLVKVAARGLSADVEALLGCDSSNRLVDARNETGDTALIAATAAGRMEVVRLLVRFGADPNVANDNLATPLHVAAQRGHTDLVRYLISKGADVTRVDGEGRNALLHAVRNGFRDTTQLLIRRGCDVFVTDKAWGWSPLHWAARHGDCVLIRTLITAGCNPYQHSKKGLTACMVGLHQERWPAVYELRLHITGCASQRVCPELQYGAIDTAPDGYEPPGREDMSSFGAAEAAREPDPAGGKREMSAAECKAADDAADEFQDQRKGRGFRGEAMTSHHYVPGAAGAARTCKDVIQHVLGTEAATVGVTGLYSIKADCWSLSPEDFPDLVGEIHVGSFAAGDKRWALSRGFSAILTVLDTRNDIPKALEWLLPDAPNPPEPPPQRRAAIVERKRRSTVAVRLMHRLNAKRLSQLHMLADSADTSTGDGAVPARTNAAPPDSSPPGGSATQRSAAAARGLTGDTRAGVEGQSEPALYSDAASESPSEDDSDFSDLDDSDPHEDARVFVKPVHMVVRAKDVDTEAGWAELLPQLAKCVKFVHTQLQQSPPVGSSDDDPTNSHINGGRVLIQCQTGNTQAPLVAMAYLIVKCGWAPWKALNVVAYGRPSVRPHRTGVIGLCKMAEGLVAREAHRRERRFVELKMASLSGL